MSVKISFINIKTLTPSQIATALEYARNNMDKQHFYDLYDCVVISERSLTVPRQVTLYNSYCVIQALLFDKYKLDALGIEDIQRICTLVQNTKVDVDTLAKLTYIYHNPTTNHTIVNIADILNTYEFI